MLTQQVTAIFVAPVLAPTTLRFVEATAGLDGVRLGLITQEGPAKLTPWLEERLSAYDRVEDGLDPAELLLSVQRIAGKIGRPQRLFGALEQLQVPLAQVREALGIPGAGVDTAKNFRDKAKMKDVLRAAGVPCARHGLAETPSQAREFSRAIGFPLVVKPPAGAAAKNTFRVNDSEELEQCLLIVPPTADRPLMLEEFIVGTEHSFDTVSIDGRPVWHSLTHYTPGPLEVMQNPWIQWTVLLPREVDHPRYNDIRSVAFRALAALGMGTGLSHMEWFRRNDGTVAVSEVGARPPGAQFTTLISYAHDVDFYRSWGKLMTLDTFDPPKRRYAAGIAYLRGQGSGRVAAIHGLDRAQEELGEMVVEVQLPQQGQHPASSYEGEGYIVLRHPQTARVEQGLKRLVELVRIELA